MTTVFQKFAAALLPFFILVIGASQTVLKDPKDVNALVTFAILVLGAILTFIVPLVGAKWQGAFKTGIAIVTTVLSALLPFLLPGGFDPSVNIPIVIVAVLNALATEFGVQIRTDTNVDIVHADKVKTVAAVPDENIVPTPADG